MPAGGRFAGSCHCGNLEVTFATRTPPEDLVVRSCACSFCRRHAARCVSDPAGAVRILVHDPSLLIRYRFGLRTAEFLVCGRCGSYLGALMQAGGAAVATLNVNAFDPPHPFERAGVPMRYDGESEPARRARRTAGWTPVVAFEAPRQRDQTSASTSIAGSAAPRQVKR
jgi:hypothetical protein